MKIINLPMLVRRLCIFAIVVIVTGCATSPTTVTKEQTPLSSSEKMLYDDALATMKAGDMDKASAGLKKLMQSHPSFAPGWINLATSYYNAKKFDEAGNALVNAKNINPNLAEVYNLAGLLDVEKGEYQSAEKNYLAAIALKNQYAAAHYNLAIVYDVFYQDINKAISQYEQYLALTDNTDKNTISWVSELKKKSKRNGS